LEKFYGQYESKGLLLFRMNTKESRESIQKFLEKNPSSLPILLDEKNKVGKLLGYGFILPLTWLIPKECFAIVRWGRRIGPGLKRSVSRIGCSEKNNDHLGLLDFPFLFDDAGMRHLASPRADSPLVPLAKANLEAVLEEQEVLRSCGKTPKRFGIFIAGGSAEGPGGG